MGSTRGRPGSVRLSPAPPPTLVVSRWTSGRWALHPCRAAWRTSPSTCARPPAAAALRDGVDATTRRPPSPPRRAGGGGDALGAGGRAARKPRGKEGRERSLCFPELRKSRAAGGPPGRGPRVPPRSPNQKRKEPGRRCPATRSQEVATRLRAGGPPLGDFTGFATSPGGLCPPHLHRAAALPPAALPTPRLPAGPGLPAVAELRSRRPRQRARAAAPRAGTCAAPAPAARAARPAGPSALPAARCCAS